MFLALVIVLLIAARIDHKGSTLTEAKGEVTQNFQNTP